jgi:hypothetical protein
LADAKTDAEVQLPPASTDPGAKVRTTGAAAAPPRRKRRRLAREAAPALVAGGSVGSVVSAIFAPALLEHRF